MMKKYELIWDNHLSRINEQKHRIVLNSTNALSIHLASYRAGLMQREPERKEINKMHETGVAEPAATE